MSWFVRDAFTWSGVVLMTSLSGFDKVLTFLGVLGGASESNPLIGWFLAVFGLVPGLLFAWLLSLIPGAFFLHKPNKKAIITINILLTTIIFWNTWILSRVIT